MILFSIRFAKPAVKKTCFRRGDWSREVKKQIILSYQTDSPKHSHQEQGFAVSVLATEAILFRDHIAGLREGLDLLRVLMETFWDTLYPEIDDGDLEFAGPLGGSAQTRCCRSPAAHHEEQPRLFRVSESRRVGYEADAVSEEKAAREPAAIAEKVYTERV
jgi:type VI secretion system protein ImpA